MSSIYLAARYSRHPEMQEIAHKLLAMGHTITSTWIWGDHCMDDCPAGQEEEHMQNFAQEDYNDVLAADTLIFFAEPQRTPTRGGRHVEFGVALAQGHRVIVVGEPENVFHYLPGNMIEIYPYAGAMLDQLATEQDGWQWTEYGMTITIDKKKENESMSGNPKDAVGRTKVPMDLLPDIAIMHGSLAMLEGALKYGRANYRDTEVAASVYIAAIKRHLAKWVNGEDTDPTTLVHHLGSVIAGAAIILDAEATGTLIDDRHEVGPDMEYELESAKNVVRHLHDAFGTDTRPLGERALDEPVSQERAEQILADYQAAYKPASILGGQSFEEYDRQFGQGQTQAAPEIPAWTVPAFPDIEYPEPSFFDAPVHDESNTFFGDHPSKRGVDKTS